MLNKHKRDLVALRWPLIKYNRKCEYLQAQKKITSFYPLSWSIRTNRLWETFGWSMICVWMVVSAWGRRAANCNDRFGRYNHHRKCPLVIGRVRAESPWPLRDWHAHTFVGKTQTLSPRSRASWRSDLVEYTNSLQSSRLEGGKRWEELKLVQSTYQQT